MKIVRKIFCIVSLCFLTCLLVAIGYYYAVTKGVSLDPEKLVLSEKSVTLYDGNGETVKNTTAFLRKQTTPIRDVPTYVKQAFISVEDKRFYKHGGFDVKRIARAALNNIKAGSFKEGASTISQQLIKNTHLNQEKTIKRKLREWKLTRQLEKNYSKDDILEKYLNSIYFGHSCFGITAASEFYFGKTPSELSLSDAAILAGLVKSPNHYSPFKNPEKCAKRKQSVLALMLKNGAIAEAEKAEALLEPLPTQSTCEQNTGYTNFVFDELTELAEKHRFTVGGKIEIYSYLDQGLQNRLEELAAQADSDKTLLVLDGEKRGFKGCVSSVGNIRRLPASLLKPLLVYAPALEENVLSPATPILDQKVNYGGYSPENYNGKFYGYVSARECVEKSLNIPAVKVLESLGVDKAAGYLEKLGLTVDAEDRSLALALGGMKNGYTLKELVSAYSALQNGGISDTCGFISAVKINGETVYKKKSSPQRVFSEDSAYLMTDMLHSTAKNGTAKKLRTLPFEVVAKTGTGGTDNANTDAYTLSYTTKDCIGVWLGNADNSEIDCTGGGLPCTLSLHIHEYLYGAYKRADADVPHFAKPENVVCVALDKPAYYDTHTLSLADDLAPMEYRIEELFKKSAIPSNKSTSFTNPTIVAPELELIDGYVKITFDNRSPSYYAYKIDRYDYATHTTVYFGEFTESFIDEEISENKNYIYTVTPAYGEREGKPIELPSVSTKQGESPPSKDRAILNKEWWEY